MDNFLVPLFSALISIIVYPMLMLYVALIAGAGVVTWLILIIMASPYVVLWLDIVGKREKLHVEGLMKPYSNMNIEQNIVDYVESQRKKRVQSDQPS